MQSHADIATSLCARAPSIAVTSIARPANELESTSLAAASIGPVHRARLSAGTRVAFRVQHPVRAVRVIERR